MADIPSKQKRIEMNRNGFILFETEMDLFVKFQILKRLSIKKKKCELLIHFNPSRGIKTK